MQNLLTTLDMHFKQAIIQFQLSFRTFDFQFDIPFKHSFILFKHSIRIFNPNIQFEHSIRIFNIQFKDSIQRFNSNIRLFNSNIQFEHSIRTFHPNIQSKHSHIVLEVTRPTSGRSAVERRERECTSKMRLTCLHDSYGSCYVIKRNFSRAEPLVMLSYIIYCDAGPGCLIKAACNYSM